ncbi:Ras-related protein Rab-18 [Halotydeus destructor]|nr:Ras-related protein Rab-18 [Halotydeus destructor]
MALNKRTLEVAVIGEGGVGKTNLLLRMSDNEFFDILASTMNIEMKQVVMKIDDTEVSLNVWDTVGQERHHALVNNYYRKIDAALLVYDVNKVDTLEALDYWSAEVDEYCRNPNVIKILVGTKLDLVPDGQPAVGPHDASEWAAKRSISYSLQTSAKSGRNVANVFEALIRLTFVQETALVITSPMEPCCRQQ